MRRVGMLSSWVVLAVALVGNARCGVIGEVAGGAEDSNASRQASATAPSPLELSTLAISYEALRARFENRDLDPIQTFGGGLVLGEFAATGDHPLAGHLGGFWAPPYYSTGGSAVMADRGFHTGLVIHNTRQASYMVYEDPKFFSAAATTATWHPSKLVVTNYYPGSGGGTRVRGAKVALPDERGFGLKVSLTNESTQAEHYRVLLVVNVPFIGKSTEWGWGGRGASAGRIAADPEVIDGRRLFRFEDRNSGAHLLLGLHDGQASWKISTPGDVVSTFWSATPGSLDDRDLLDELPTVPHDPKTNRPSDPASLGLVVDLQIPAGARRDFTMVGFVGTRDEVIGAWRSHPRTDIESRADAAWQRHFDELFTRGLPRVSFPDPQLTQLYYRSAFQYLLNRWEKPRWIAQQNLRLNSLPFFSWTQGTEQFLTLADPALWRAQLLALLRTAPQCQATSPFEKHYCPAHGRYSYARLTLVRAIYEHVAATSDASLLRESVPFWHEDGRVESRRLLDALALGVNAIDTAAGDGDRTRGAGLLVDFGHDQNLYELSHPPCSLGGKYTGKVATPNAERYQAHRLLAELYDRLGEKAPATAHRDLADRNRAALQRLWNGSWFDTISTWESCWIDGQNPGPCQRRQSEYRHTFYFEPILNALGFDGLLDPAQRQQLLASVPRFMGPYGFYAIDPVQWGQGCDHRSDWAGPGLYSGNTGLLLADLFAAGESARAYDMLSPADGRGYAYLASLPIWAQQFEGRQPKMKGNRTWYIESVSVAQALIKGMMGLAPTPSLTVLRPRIPARLLGRGNVVFRDAIAQGHRWTLTGRSNATYLLDVVVSHDQPPMARHFRLGWAGDRGARVALANLDPAVEYRVRGAQSGVLVARQRVGSDGSLRFTLPVTAQTVWICEASLPADALACGGR